MPSVPTTMLSLRVQTELARLLNAMPNKSQFIRAAILAHLHTACPLCGGTGVLPPSVVRYFATILRESADQADPPA